MTLPPSRIIAALSIAILILSAGLLSDAIGGEHVHTAQGMGAAETTEPSYRTPPLLPWPPGSAERMAPMDALKNAAPDLARGFAAFTYSAGTGDSMPYRLYTPDPIEPGRKLPLVIFLHGAAGSGADNEKQLQDANRYGALTWARPEVRQRHPAFILAPQSNVNWPCVIIPDLDRPLTAKDVRICPGNPLGKGARLVLEIVDHLLATLPIDAHRIYVTGHSMGGAGTWHLISKRPRFFAAAVPVSGKPDPSTAADIKDVPIWNFHGADDEIEPVATSRIMIEAIRKAGGSPLYTEYPGVGHEAFAYAYTEPAVIDWLFAQRR